MACIDRPHMVVVVVALGESHMAATLRTWWPVGWNLDVLLEHWDQTSLWDIHWVDWWAIHLQKTPRGIKIRGSGRFFDMNIAASATWRGSHGPIGTEECANCTAGRFLSSSLDSSLGCLLVECWDEGSLHTSHYTHFGILHQSYTNHPIQMSITLTSRYISNNSHE